MQIAERRACSVGGCSTEQCKRKNFSIDVSGLNSFLQSFMRGQPGGSKHHTSLQTILTVLVRLGATHLEPHMVRVSSSVLCT